MFVSSNVFWGLEFVGDSSVFSLPYHSEISSMRVCEKLYYVDLS